MTRLAGLLTLTFLAAAAAWAQERAAPPSSPPTEVVATFADGTVIRKATLKDPLDIMTRYGKLTVPSSDIRRIEFRTYLPPETTKKIAELIDQLGSEAYARREAASKALIALGAEAYPHLEEAIKSPDQEVARRAQLAVEHLRQTLPEEELRSRPNDVIYTTDCVLTGKIATTTLKAHTENFGDMEFKLGHLRSLHLAQSQSSLALEATAAGKWVETDVTVDRGVGMIITAAGQITVNPQATGPEGAIGPEGNPNLGQSPQGYPYGTLLGRIGPSGDIFAVGQRYEAKVPADGKLHLYFLAPPTAPGTPAPTGSYKVTVLSGRDVEVKEPRSTSRTLPPGYDPRRGRGGFSRESLPPGFDRNGGRAPDR